MDRLRLHHGTASDLKFTIIAKRSGQLRGIVLAAWTYILEYASTHEDRGSVAGIDPEEIACCLDIAIEDAEQILSAMTEKGLIVDGRLSSWEKRQPRREDETGAERQRKYKEKQRLENIGTQDNTMERTVTHGNATKRPEKRREEETLKDLKDLPEKNPPAESASLKPSKPPKAKTTDPRHAWLTRWWCWSFETVTGSRYAYGKQDAGIIADILKKIDFSQTLERSCCYLLMTDDQRFPRGAPTLKGLALQINQLAGSFRDETETKALAYRLLPPKGTMTQNYRPWEAP